MPTPQHRQIALTTWASGLAGALSWIPALAPALLSPSAPTVAPGAFVLGVVGTVAAASFAGRQASASSVNPRATAAWAGAHVGAMSLVLGLWPTLAVWSQLPSLTPAAFGPPPDDALSFALVRSAERMLRIPLVAAPMLLGGALVGGLSAAAGGSRHLPTPGRATTLGAAVGLALNLLGLEVTTSTLTGMLDTMARAADEGLPVATGALAPLAAPLFGATYGVLAAVAAAMLTAGLRRRPGWLLAVMLGLALVLVRHAGHMPAAGLVTWAGLASFGATAGLLLPLDPRLPAPPFSSLSVRAAPLLVLAEPGAIAMGLALGLGAVARIAPLRELGGAAPLDAAISQTLVAVPLLGGVVLIAGVTWVLALGVGAALLVRKLRSGRPPGLQAPATS